MGRGVYKKKNYQVIKVGNGFIIHNTNEEFDDYHTHLKSLNTCKMLIDCLIYKKIPKTRNRYLLSSLVRITDDKEYADKIDQLIRTRANKGKEPCKRRAI